MKRSLLLCFSTLAAMAGAMAQTPTDGVMMKSRESCLALIYDRGSFDHYWEGTNLRTNETIATVHRITTMPMLAIGVHDRLNVILAAPYVKTFSTGETGGKFSGVQGFQDFGIYVKGEPYRVDLGPGRFSTFATVGLTTPMTNYLSDYMPYSLGFGATEISGRGILQYKMNMGLYARLMAGYLWRGQTQVERDFYYNNGSYYSDWMDVPSAITYQGVLGMSLFDNGLRVEATYTALNSTSGDDIRKYNSPQPTNKAEWGMAGFSAQFFLKKPKGLGFIAYCSKVLSGRNVGQSTNFGIGATYQFKI